MLKEIVSSQITSKLQRLSSEELIHVFSTKQFRLQMLITSDYCVLFIFYSRPIVAVLASVPLVILAPQRRTQLPRG